MIKMMAAVAVFAVAVLVTPESTGAGAPKKAMNGDCAALAGTYTNSFGQDFAVHGNFETITMIHCDFTVRFTLKADCSVVDSEVTYVDCYEF